MGRYGKAHAPYYTGDFSAGEIYPDLTPVALPASLISYYSFRANWEAFPGAVSYIFELSYDPMFENKVPGYESVIFSDSLFCDIIAPFDNQTYYYRIKVVTDAYTTSYSNVIQLRTLDYQVHVLTVQDCLHILTSDNIFLGLTYPDALNVDDSWHGHQADSLNLSPVETLTVNDCIHAHSADSIDISVDEMLYPASVATQTISNEAIDVTWTNQGEYQYVRVERSSDGVSFTEIGYVTGDQTIYHDTTGLTMNRQYWYRLRADNYGAYSDYSVIVNDWTAWKIVFHSSGNGILNLNPYFSGGSRKLTVDNGGEIYDDWSRTGTPVSEKTGQSISAYMTLPNSGDYNVMIFHKGDLTQMGQGIITGWGYMGFYMQSNVTADIYLADLPRSLTHLGIIVYGGIYGALADLPPGILNIDLGGQGNITG